MENGAQLIAKERERQISAEGWCDMHDDEHDSGELVDAALSYIRAAINNGKPAMEKPPREWPWENKWWKPTPSDPVRELTKAGALIAAEIDRLKRLEALNERMG